MVKDSFCISCMTQGITNAPSTDVESSHLIFKRSFSCGGRTKPLAGPAEGGQNRYRTCGERTKPLPGPAEGGQNRYLDLRREDKNVTRTCGGRTKPVTGPAEGGQNRYLDLRREDKNVTRTCGGRTKPLPGPAEGGQNRYRTAEGGQNRYLHLRREDKTVIWTCGGRTKRWPGPAEGGQKRYPDLRQRRTKPWPGPAADGGENRYPDLRRREDKTVTWTCGRGRTKTWPGNLLMKYPKNLKWMTRLKLTNPLTFHVTLTWKQRKPQKVTAPSVSPLISNVQYSTQETTNIKSLQVQHPIMPKSKIPKFLWL